MEIISIIVSAIIALLVSIISTSVTMWGWRRNRNIYDIEFEYIKEAEYKDDKKNSLKRKLNSGNYTILNSYYDSPYYKVILGKIKK